VAPASPANRRPPFVTVLIALLPPLVLGACSDPAYLLAGENLPFNFHELDPGKAYRSAQPTAKELENVINLLGIRTVVNLRGPNPGDDWYDSEVEVCGRMGVTLSDQRMSEQSLPDPDRLREITDVLRTAEYPILVHCMGGAGRTGVVAVIYRMLIAGDDRDAALEQLSPAFLHFRFITPCVDTFAELYEPTDDWLATYAETFDQLTCR
jgi:protein tyrosine/serine phosphatase